MANVYLKSFTLGSSQYVPLVGAATVMNATLLASVKNANPVNVRFRGGLPAAWPPGAAVFLEGVDLAEFEVQGTAGHQFLVAGYTR